MRLSGITLAYDVQDPEFPSQYLGEEEGGEKEERRERREEKLMKEKRKVEWK